MIELVFVLGGKKYSVIELFAGAGGLALGLENAGFHHEALVEINKHACATLRKNRPDWNVIEDDVSKIDWTRYSADVVSGGFPCQAFSQAGKRLGFEEARGTLFFEFARCVKEINPKMFIAENVAGLTTHKKGKTLATMLSVLRSMGYKVEYNILDSQYFNVPQKRKRIFIIGTRDDIQFTFPKPGKKPMTLAEGLYDVPNSEGAKYTPKRKKYLELVPPGGCWIDLPLELQKEFMGKSFYSSGGRRGMARRIAWNEPCLTLTTSPAQKQTERCHPDETRPFTVREYARIQTFPDSWMFEGSMATKYLQIGNAVPVKLAEAVAKEVINALDGKTTKISQMNIVEYPMIEICVANRV